MSDFRLLRTAPLLALAALAACASDTSHPVGPLESVLITLQPARITPHERGALLLSTFTGCYVEFVGKGPSEFVYEFKIAPTRRVPSLDQCLTSLRNQPGVTAIARK
jgi:hypothetical protein